MNKRADGSELIIFLVVLLGAFLIWGMIGAHQADKVGISCDWGFGEDNSLCWKWHQNVIGEAIEAYNDATDNDGG